MLRPIIIALLLLLGLAIVSRAQVVPFAPPARAIACAYSISPPAPVSGQFYLVQCNSSGALLVSQ